MHPHDWRKSAREGPLACRAAGANTASMNVVAPVRRRLSVEVVYDLICPWCYLGIRRLMRALASRDDVTFDITWRPFLLNPDMTRLGMARGDYVVRKFGGEERARRLYGTITETGAAEGIRFRFDLIRRTPSSVDGHRLVQFAAQHGKASDLVGVVFERHFGQGQDTGNIEVLVSAAEEAGLDAREARAFLDSEAGFEQVHAENLRAHRLGINGVPCFIAGERHAITGAQEVEVIDRLLDVALVDVNP